MMTETIHHYCYIIRKLQPSKSLNLEYYFVICFVVHRLPNFSARGETKHKTLFHLIVLPCVVKHGSQATLSGRVVQMSPYIAMSTQRANQNMFAPTRPKKVNIPMMRTTCSNAQMTRNTSRWFRPCY